MKLASFVGTLGLGGAEKAACRRAWGRKAQGHQATVLTMIDGPCRAELERHIITFRHVTEVEAIVSQLEQIKPDAIHTHWPGDPFIGDVLGDTLARLPKIPVVQTNSFGHLFNPREDAWTRFRQFRRAIRLRLGAKS